MISRHRIKEICQRFIYSLHLYIIIYSINIFLLDLLALRIEIKMQNTRKAIPFIIYLNDIQFQSDLGW